MGGGGGGFRYFLIFFCPMKLLLFNYSSYFSAWPTNAGTTLATCEWQCPRCATRLLTKTIPQSPEPDNFWCWIVEKACWVWLVEELQQHRWQLSTIFGSRWVWWKLTPQTPTIQDHVVTTCFSIKLNAWFVYILQACSLNWCCINGLTALCHFSNNRWPSFSENCWYFCWITNRKISWGNIM